jgi:histidyl-tRNA synthetase
VKVASVLRKAGQSVDVVLEDKKAKWVFRHADRLGAKYCVVVGQSEFEAGEVSVKDLAAGTQQSIKLEALETWASSNQS